MARMNWSRARMDRIISERGFVSTYEPPPPRESPRNRAGAATVVTRRRPAKPRHRYHHERRRLLHEFDELAAADQVRRAPKFRERLRRISTSDADCKAYWASAFDQRLRSIATHGPALTAASPRANASRKPAPKPSTPANPNERMTKVGRMMKSDAGTITDGQIRNITAYSNTHEFFLYDMEKWSMAFASDFYFDMNAMVAADGE